VAGLRDEIANTVTDGRSLKPCAYSRILTALDAADARELEEIVADRSVGIGAIVAVLERRGFKAPRHMIDHHRSNECQFCRRRRSQ